MGYLPVEKPWVISQKDFGFDWILPKPICLTSDELDLSPARMNDFSYWLNCKNSGGIYPFFVIIVKNSVNLRN